MLKLTPPDLVDAAIAFAVQTGFSKSAAKVFALLLVCDPMQQSARDMQKALNLSVGTVSEAVNMLIRVGLVDRVTVPGDRRHFYALQPHGFKQAIRQRAQTVSMARELAEKGLILQPGNKRLSMMKDVYSLFESEMENILNRMDRIST